MQNFRTQAPDRETAIVFVHGFTGDIRTTWGNIPTFLGAAPELANWDLIGFGYESHRQFDVRDIWSADPALAQIDQLLFTELSLRKHKQIAFVAHSMGGLIVQRALLNYPDLRKRTSHVFLFGTPSGGLEKANLASFFKTQIENMSPQSQYMRSLRKDWTDAGFDVETPFVFQAIAGEKDQFVPPKSSLECFRRQVQRVVPGDHLSMLNADAATADCVQIVLQGLTKQAGLPQSPRDSARLAVERGEFREIEASYGPHRHDLDPATAVQLAIALEALGKTEEAIAYLKERALKLNHTDLIGTFAGRIKRRWQVEHRMDDLKAAMDLYSVAYEMSSTGIPVHHQAYYHGINIAFLLLETHKPEEALKMADKVLTHTRAVQPLERDDRLWHTATEGDALLIRKDTLAGMARHKDAASLRPKPWQALSIGVQAYRVGELCGLDPAQLKQLSDWYGKP